MYYSGSSTTYLNKNGPKIVDTIRINGKYFDASKVRERILIVVSSSAIISALMAIAAFIIF